MFPRWVSFSRAWGSVDSLLSLGFSDSVADAEDVFGFLFSEDGDVDSGIVVSGAVLVSSCSEGISSSPALKPLPNTPSTVRSPAMIPTIPHCIGDEVWFFDMMTQVRNAGTQKSPRAVIRSK